MVSRSSRSPHQSSSSRQRLHASASGSTSTSTTHASRSTRSDDSSYDDSDYLNLGDSSSVVEGPVLARCGRPSRRRSTTATTSTSRSSFLEAFSCLCIGTSVGGLPHDYVDTQEEESIVTRRSHQRRHTASTTSTLLLNALSPAFSSSSSSSSCTDGTPVSRSPNRSTGSSKLGSFCFESAVTTAAPRPSLRQQALTSKTTTKLVVPKTYVTDLKTGVLVKRPRKQEFSKRRTSRSNYTFRPLVTLAEQETHQADKTFVGSNHRGYINQTGRKNLYMPKTRSTATNNTVDSIYTIRVREENKNLGS
jgi:hypothetical protein